MARECPKCGVFLREGENVCPNCGARIGIGTGRRTKTKLNAASTATINNCTRASSNANLFNSPSVTSYVSPQEYSTKPKKKKKPFILKLVIAIFVIQFAISFIGIFGSMIADHFLYPEIESQKIDTNYVDGDGYLDEDEIDYTFDDLPDSEIKIDNCGYNKDGIYYYLNKYDSVILDGQPALIMDIYAETESGSGMPDKNKFYILVDNETVSPDLVEPVYNLQKDGRHYFQYAIVYLGKYTPENYILFSYGLNNDYVILDTSSFNNPIDITND